MERVIFAILYPHGGEYLEILLSWPGGDWQTTLRLVGAVVAGYFLLLWATYILWVARDIRLRTHDPVSQIIAILIAIILPFVTFPIYITLRPRETLQDSYLKLLEREVLFSQLEEIQNNSQVFQSNDLNSLGSTLLAEMDAHELIESSEPTLFFDDVDEIEFDEFDSQVRYSLTSSEDEVINEDIEEFSLEDEVINEDIEDIFFRIFVINLEIYFFNFIKRKFLGRSLDVLIYDFIL
ncbi:MAG: hypothetical protein MKZ81_00300 [Dehalococcoidia bacterium]|nr:hypothetical protein [Dehalococcoidia bacterium]